MKNQGFSREGLRRVHDVMEGYVERGEVEGLVALVGRPEDLHTVAMGKLALEGGKSVSHDTIFRISSMTKPITAAATMILVDESKVGLDEPVDRLLPELADRRVLKRLDGPLDDTIPAKRPITVRDLLTFRMGLGIVMTPPGTYSIQAAMEELRLGQGPPQPALTPGPDDWMRRLGTLPLIHQPGEKWMYNTGSDVLGVLVSRASGRSFEAFLRERIFEPLGMKDTGFSVPNSKIDRLTACYWTNYLTGRFELYDPPRGGQWSRPPAFPSGGGGLVSTIDDYLAFAQMMLNGGKHGGKRVLSERSVRMMISDQLAPEQKAASGLVPGYFDGHGWGFGVSVVTKSGKGPESVGTYGWDGGLGTCWRSDPKKGLIAILMTTRAWSSASPPAVWLDFLSSAYDALGEREH